MVAVGSFAPTPESQCSPHGALSDATVHFFHLYVLVDGFRVATKGPRAVQGFPMASGYDERFLVAGCSLILETRDPRLVVFNFATLCILQLCSTCGTRDLGRCGKWKTREVSMRKVVRFAFLFVEQRFFVSNKMQN